MPRQDQLSEDIHALAFKNAMEIPHGHFHLVLEDLSQTLRDFVKQENRTINKKNSCGYSRRIYSPTKE